jgi:hypothetical protein
LTSAPRDATNVIPIRDEHHVGQQERESELLVEVVLPRVSEAVMVHDHVPDALAGSLGG